jgi:uncharacterized protein (TIRG00374 family)
VTETDPPRPSPPVEIAAEPVAPPSRLKTVLRGLLGTLGGLAVAVAAAYFLKVTPAKLAASLKDVSLWAVLACVVSSFVVIGFQSLRWHGVMGPLLGLRWSQAYRAQAVGVMFNALLPARGGDLLRVQYLGRRTGKSRAAILGTEIVDRWLDFWGWIPVILVLAIFFPIPRWVFTAVGIFGALLVSWGAAMLILTRRGYVPKPGSRFGRVYQSLQGGIQAFRSPRTWMLAALVAPLPWLWEAFFVSQITGSFGIHISMTQAACVLVGWNLAMVVPSPGSVGTVEAGGSTVLMLFGADPSRAMAFMLVYHLAQLLPGIILGIAILVAENERLVGAPSTASAPPASTPTPLPER